MLIHSSGILNLPTCGKMKFEFPATCLAKMMMTEGSQGHCSPDARNVSLFQKNESPIEEPYPRTPCELGTRLSG